jgi:hypothetical protein
MGEIPATRSKCFGIIENGCRRSNI